MHKVSLLYYKARKCCKKLLHLKSINNEKSAYCHWVDKSLNPSGMASPAYDTVRNEYAGRTEIP